MVTVARRVYSAVMVIACICMCDAGPAFTASLPDTLRVAYFSRDVPAAEPLSPAFDPDSYSVITQIFDSLIHADLDGNLVPGLATEWLRLSERTWAFTLRKGVRFHNGEPFDGHAVKFTYEYVLNPENRAGNAWILNTIESVTVDPEDPYRVIITTRFEDGMFLNRFPMFGSICPPGLIRRVGLEAFARHPVGTGPYKFVEWERNDHITLERNEAYWNTSLPVIPRLRFEILPEDQWTEAILDGRVDFIPNLAGNQTSRLMKAAKGEVRILKRLVLSGYWVLLRNRGPLADVRVRRALNYALNRDDLVRYADLGNATPLASLGKQGEFGKAPGLKPYPYDPDRARSLLVESGIKAPLTLRVLVADVAKSVAKVMRAQLRSVGVNLEMEFVSRAEWANRIVGHKIKHGSAADYDLAINLVDNPIYNLAFHAGLFLQSQSPWSLLDHGEFDIRYALAFRISDQQLHRERLEELDRYIHDQALMIFTTQKIVTAAVRRRFHIPEFALNGHLDYYTLTTATVSEAGK